MEAVSGQNSIGPTGILRWIDNSSLQRMMSGVEAATVSFSGYGIEQNPNGAVTLEVTAPLGVNY